MGRPPIPGGPMRALSLRITKRKMRDLQGLAIVHGTSVSEQARRLVDVGIACAEGQCPHTAEIAVQRERALVAEMGVVQAGFEALAAEAECQVPDEWEPA